VFPGAARGEVVGGYLDATLGCRRPRRATLSLTCSVVLGSPWDNRARCSVGSNAAKDEPRATTHLAVYSVVWVLGQEAVRRCGHAIEGVGAGNVKRRQPLRSALALWVFALAL